MKIWGAPHFLFNLDKVGGEQSLIFSKKLVIKIDMERSKDWLKQAKKDLKHAYNSLEAHDYEWSCFAAQQAAEKSVKAIYQKIGADAWGHSVSIMLSELPENIKPDKKLIDMAKELDKHYIPTMYPNFHPDGAPLDYYTEVEAKRAISHAEKIISFCENKILR